MMVLDAGMAWCLVGVGVTYAGSCLPSRVNKKPYKSGRMEVVLSSESILSPFACETCIQSVNRSQAASK